MTGRVAVVGAGPAGIRTAEVLVRAGLAVTVLDEAPQSGGRIYQRAPQDGPLPTYAHPRRAAALHAAFDSLRPHIDYRPETLVWDVEPGRLHTIRDGETEEVSCEAAILCTGAMDRVIPLPGWTLPGVVTLGGAQIALKIQGCAVGQRVAFVGTGPLLWLVARQYAAAGAGVALVLETTPRAVKARQFAALLCGGRQFAEGVGFVARLHARRVPIAEGATPLCIVGSDDGTKITGLQWQDARGRHETPCDAVALGWGLQPEAQLAELAGVPFAFDIAQHQWLPLVDTAGRTDVPGIFLAGDGARIAGAEVAELAGARAAWAAAAQLGGRVDPVAVARLDAALCRHSRFRAALDRAFPWPAALAAGMPDATILCRCEGVTAGTLRGTVQQMAQEANRAKALSRVGMGRCQGRVCGAAAAEVLAAALQHPLQSVGRLRGQPPVKPIPVSAGTRTTARD